MLLISKVLLTSGLTLVMGCIGCAIFHEDALGVEWAMNLSGSTILAGLAGVFISLFMLIWQG